MTVKITCLGTGTFGDIQRRNTSFLCEIDRFSILVDCGYSVYPAAVRALGGIASLSERPNVVLLTHVHGDHTGSLPQLILMAWQYCDETKKARHFRVLGERGAIEGAKASFEIEYPGIASKLFPLINFTVNWEAGEKWDLGFCSITSAPSVHGVENQSYRFKVGNLSFGISGDGEMTDATRDLFRGVDLLIHEGHSVITPERSHGSIKDVVEYAVANNVKRVALVHVHPRERLKLVEISQITTAAAAQGVKAWLPNDGEEIFL